MPFTPINVVNGSTPANATWGNLVQTQYTEAALSFEQNLFTPFVLGGFVATKDGTTANQLDVTGGTAFPMQSDNTLRQRTLNASTQVTSALSSTYHLYLQPDGTFYWNTANSPAANSLAIANVTTDGSGNISTVSDQRVTATTLLSAMTGLLKLGAGGLAWVDSTGSLTAANLTGLAATLSKVASLNGQATVGNFGVPTVVAQTINQHITSTALQTVLTYTPAVTGLYRVSGCITVNNGTPGGATVRVAFGYQDPNTGTAGGNFFYSAPFSGSTMLVFNAAPSTPNSTYSLGAQMFYAQASNAITVTYTDSTNTPNDFISVLVERIS